MGAAGTYIRSLAGPRRGRRQRRASRRPGQTAGGFTLEEAVPLDDVRAAAADGPEALASRLLPLDSGLDLPIVAVPDAALVAIGRGHAIGGPAGAVVLPADRPLRLVDERGRLVAIARLAGTKLAPDKVLLDGGEAA
jgi:tRNA U55 pseudouridine synthase TruB